MKATMSSFVVARLSECMESGFMAQSASVSESRAANLRRIEGTHAMCCCPVLLRLAGGGAGQRGLPVQIVEGAEHDAGSKHFRQHLGGRVGIRRVNRVGGHAAAAESGQRPGDVRVLIGPVRAQKGYSGVV